jgi:hypothetical protein
MQHADALEAVTYTSNHVEEWRLKARVGDVK